MKQSFEVLFYIQGVEAETVFVMNNTPSYVGFSKANNLGFRSIAHGAGSLVIFINPDTFLEPSFVESYKP